jgi:hypothetical protein
MSTKTTSFTFGRSQQPKARIERRQPSPVERAQGGSSRQPARRASRAQRQEQPDTSRNSIPQAVTALPRGRRPKTKGQEKIQPKTARRQRAFQIGAVRPKFRKTQVKGSTLQTQSAGKNRKVTSIEIVPQFKRVKI